MTEREILLDRKVIKTMYYGVITYLGMIFVFIIGLGVGVMLGFKFLSWFWLIIS